MRMTIEPDTVLPQADLLQTSAACVLEDQAVRDKELSLFFCSPGTMARLNREYRGQEGATDVLAFAQQEGPRQGFDSGLLGDVVVCPAEVIRRSADENAGGDALLRTLIHGILHLLGYDHEAGEDQAAAMRALENAILARMEDNHVV